jgi:hypothetical protein
VPRERRTRTLATATRSCDREARERPRVLQHKRLAQSLVSSSGRQFEKIRRARPLPSAIVFVCFRFGCRFGAGSGSGSGDAPSTPGRPLRDVLEPDRKSSRGHSLRHLHVRVRDREPPGLQLARPRSEVVLRDAHHLHRNDLRNVLFELHLIDDALDRYIAPVVGRLGE